MTLSRHIKLLLATLTLLLGAHLGSAQTTVAIDTTVCDTFYWAAFDTTLTADTAISRTRHDTTFLLTLTVHHHTLGIKAVEQCDSFYYDVADQKFYASTTYTDTLRRFNQYDCDSIRTLLLTIYHSTTADPLLITACDSYYWQPTAQSYSASGLYHGKTVNSHGCDSIVSLSLTIYNNPVLGLTADTAIHQCTSLPLEASGADFYIWQADTTLDTQYTATVVATPTATTTYSVRGYTMGEDLAVNGTFKNGNSGFTSSYDYFAITNTTEGQYTVGNDAHRFHTTFSTTYDHTQGNSTGKYLIVNGAGTPGSIAWQQTVEVLPGNYYVFDIYAVNVNQTYNGVAPALLQFSINSRLMDTVHVLPTTPGLWKQYRCVWYNDTAHTAVLAIVNQNSELRGNDFGIDDISFTRLACSAQKEVRVQVLRDTIYGQECNTYTWRENNISYSDAGTYTVRRTTASGCDSLATLVLTLGASREIHTVDSACQEYTWTFNRHTYTASNRYYDTILNSDGCYDYGILDVVVQYCTRPDFPDNVDSNRCMMLQPATEWSIRNAWSSGGGVSNHNTPMVGDLDGDGNPDILCFGSNGETDYNGLIDNRMRVYDGVTKQLKCEILMPAYVTAYDAGAYGLVRLPNGKGLIVTACVDLKLRAYDITSATPNVPYWTSDVDYNTNRQYAVNINFADFNNDGNPELAVCNKIYNAATGVLLGTASGGQNAGASYAHYSHRTGRTLYSPAVANIVGDDYQELILGNEIYSVNINNLNGTAGNSITLAKRIEPPAGVVNDGHAQVCDFDLDGHADIFISNKNIVGSGGKVSMYVWDVARNRVSAPVDIPCHMSGKSIPLIADIDGDDNLEVTIQCAASGVGSNHVRTYKFNAATGSFEFMWGYPVDEDSYSNGMTAFDFNLDGETEMLICDQSRIRVVNGQGETMNSFNFSETTIMQYPVIADVDNDGHAEIVSVGSGRLNIFKSSGQPWAPARKVWNQYMYNVTNVNNDLTVPRYYYSSATTLYDPDDGHARRPYNNFLQQATSIDQYGRPYYTAIDMVADSATATITADSAMVRLYYSNRGSNTMYGPYHITLYKDTMGGSVLHSYTINDTVNRDELKVIDVPLSMAELCQLRATRYLYSVNDAGSGIAQNGGLTNECDTTNNTTYIVLPLPEPEESVDSVTACNSYVWFANSHEYFASGIHSDTITCQRPAAAGCDSIRTLVLTINSSVADTTVVDACDSYVWPVTGELFTKSTRITENYTTSLGCDSTWTLRLNMHRTYIHDTIIEGCDSYYWSVDRRTYTRSTVHTEYMKSPYGCDSNITLTLNMHYRFAEELFDTLCEGAVRTFFGQNYTRSGVYVFNGSSLAGCDSTVTLNLTIRPAIHPDFDSLTDCEARTITLHKHPADSNIVQVWKVFPDDGSLRGREWDSTIVLSPTLSTVYSLAACYKEGMPCATAKSISVQPIEPVVASIDQSAERFTPTIQNIHLTSTGSGATTYAWFRNGMYYSFKPSISLESPQTDSLRITLIAFNNRCSDTARITLGVLNDAIYIPNVFTPTEERDNHFTVKGLNIIEYEIAIFTRGGVMVYHSDTMNEGWDGTHDGTPCPQGAYVYNIRYRSKVAPKEVQHRTGAIMLIR